METFAGQYNSFVDLIKEWRNNRARHGIPNILFERLVPA